MTRFRPTVLTILAALTAFLPVQSLAQAASPLPNAQTPEWYSIVAALAMAVLIGVGSFKNAKRTHLD